MTEEFKVGQKVRHKQEPKSLKEKTILHIDGNVAMVKDWWGASKLIKLTDLVSAEPPKEEPFKPGWFRLVGRPTNFHYYVTAQIGGAYYYTHAFNPVTGEMEGPLTGGFPVIIGSQVLSARRGDLIRLKFVDA